MSLYPVEKGDVCSFLSLLDEEQSQSSADRPTQHPQEG
jgi:hypothetical protein